MTDKTNTERAIKEKMESYEELIESSNGYIIIYEKNIAENKKKIEILTAIQRDYEFATAQEYFNLAQLMFELSICNDKIKECLQKNKKQKSEPTAPVTEPAAPTTALTKPAALAEPKKQFSLDYKSIELLLRECDIKFENYDKRFERYDYISKKTVVRNILYYLLRAGANNGYDPIIAEQAMIKIVENLDTPITNAALTFYYKTVLHKKAIINLTHNLTIYNKLTDCDKCIKCESCSGAFNGLIFYCGCGVTCYSLKHDYASDDYTVHIIHPLIKTIV
jgi:hypothetical protein